MQIIHGYAENASASVELPNYCAIVQNIPVSFEVFTCLFQLTIDTRCVERGQGSSSRFSICKGA